MATVELIHALVAYVVCGDRVEARVRTYGNGRALEEATVVFSEKELNALNTPWTEQDILTLLGCDCWITDAQGLALTVDLTNTEPTIIAAPSFAQAIFPVGTLLAGLIEPRQPHK